MKNVWRIFIFVTLLLFEVGVVSSFEFDNVKKVIPISKGESFNLEGKTLTYNDLWEKYKPIEIENVFGLGEKLFSGAITEHTEICSRECYSNIQLYISNKDVLIQDIKFYTLKWYGKEEEPIESYTLFIKKGDTEYTVLEYKTTCSKSGTYPNGSSITTCIKEQTGSHKEYVPIWEKYNIGDKVEPGTYEIKIEGIKDKLKNVDWEIKTQGIWTTDWAVWTSGLATGLKRWWTFNESSGTTALDTMGNDNLELSNNWTGGLIGNSFNWTVLISAPGYTQTGSPWNTLNSSGNNMTVNFWLNKTGLWAAPGADDRDIISQFSDGANFGDWTFQGIDDNLNIRMQINDGGTKTSDNVPIPVAAGSPYQGKWFMVTIRFNSTTAWIQINGTNHGQEFFDISSWRPNGANWDFLCRTGGNCMRNGQIDEWGIWNRILTDSEISDLYNNGVGLTPAQLTSMTVVNSHPANHSNLTSTTVIFGCNATGFDNNVTFIVLNATNSSGSNWNQTNVSTIGGISYNATFTNTSLTDGNYTWNCLAYGTAANSSSGMSVFRIDSHAPAVKINLPTSILPYGFFRNNETLNWTISDTHLQTIWYNYNGTNITVYGGANETKFNITNPGYIQNITIWANDSFGNINSSYVQWNYTIFVNSWNYSKVTYETVNETFLINVTGATTVVLNYNGTNYTTTQSGTTWTRVLDIPEVTYPGNRTFYWIFQTGNTTIFNQSALDANFSICRADGGLTPFLNFTFKDESDGTILNASNDLTSATYWIGAGTVNKSYTFTNTSVNYQYTFCGVPNLSFIVDMSFKYSNPSYPLRTWAYDDQTLSNATTTKVLYLLSDDDGIYSSIKTADVIGTPISGALIQYERQISGVWTLIGQELTGDDGIATFWVDPNYQYRFTATKTGYTDVQVTIQPSQTTYTIVMSSTSGTGSYDSDFEGIYYYVYPGSGTLEATTNMKFNATVWAKLGNLENCSFEILNQSNVSQVLKSGYGFTNSSYCFVDLTYTTVKNTRLFGRVGIDTTGTSGFVYIDSDVAWILFDFDKKAWRSIGSLFDDLKDLAEFGEGNEAEFNRIVLFFLILTILIGVFTYFSGVELSTPGLSIIIIWGICLFASIGNFLTFNSGTISTPMRRFGFFFIFTAILIGYGISIARRTGD